MQLGSRTKYQDGAVYLPGMKLHVQILHLLVKWTIFVEVKSERDNPYKSCEYTKTSLLVTRTRRNVQTPGMRDLCT